MDEAASGVRQLPWKHMKQESICMTPLGIQYQDHLIGRQWHDAREFCRKCRKCSFEGVIASATCRLGR